MFTRADRGIEAAWLRDERKARWSNVHKALDGFRQATGVAIDYARWASYESGRKPIRDDHMEAFIAFFGTEPKSVETPEADLASAIRALTEAVRDQMAAAEEREARLTDRMVAVLEALALGRGAAANGDELHVHGNAGR